MKHKLKKLLDGSLEATYWLGFILADGHLSKTNRLKIALSIKDTAHLEKLKNFLGVGNIHYYSSSCELSVMDTKTIRKLKEEYSTSSTKTYDPPDISNIRGKHLLALGIGFIDGDGSIGFQYGRTDVLIRVKCHCNWKDNLETMFGTNAIIDSAGYATINIGDNRKIKALKQFALDECLPIMERKWDKIDMTHTNRTALADWRAVQVEGLLMLGYQQKDIAKELNMTKGGVSLLISRRGITN